MKVAVTGSSGVLGSAVLRALSSRGRLTIGLQRSPSTVANRRAADLSSADAVMAALEGIDVVVHTASASATPSTEVVYVQNIIEAAKRRLLAHILFVSIINVDRSRQFAYYAAKYDAETLLSDSGVPHTIVRAAQFHPFVAYLLSQSAKTPIAILPWKAAFQPIEVEALAEHLADIAQRDPVGRARDVAGPEILAGSYLYKTWKQHTGVTKPAIELPLPIPVFRVVSNGRLINADADRIGPSWEEWLKRHGRETSPYASRSRL